MRPTREAAEAARDKENSTWRENLIRAAAPDMLAALKELLGDDAEWFQQHPDDYDKRAGDSLGKSIYRARWLRRERAHAAIAKAEGR